MSTTDVLITPGSGEVKWVDSGGADFIRIIGDNTLTNTMTFVGDDNTSNGVVFQDHATDILYPATSGLNLGVSANRWNIYATGGDFSSAVTIATNLTFSGTSSTITLSGTSSALNMSGSSGLFTLSNGASISLTGATSSITLSGLSSVLTLAGVTGTNLAPLKFTTGSAPATSVAGQMWWTGSANLQFATTNGTASTFVFLDTDISTFTTGTLGVGHGGTGTSTAFTLGSVVFAGTSGVYAQDNANFFWDGTNHTHGIGTTRTGAISGTNPGMRIKGTGTTSSTSSFEVQNSSAATLFFVRDDGLINFGSSGTFTNSTGQLALSTSGSGAGILLGGDTNLYRSATKTLKTDNSFIASLPQSSTSTVSVVAQGVTALEVNSSGYIKINYGYATAVFTTAANGSVGAADTGGYADVTTTFNTSTVNITNGGTLYNRFYIGYYAGTPAGISAQVSQTGGVAGVTGVILWEIWNGSSWATITGGNLTTDIAFNITSAATSQTTINGVAAYWIRGTVSTAYSTAPVAKISTINGLYNRTNAPWAGAGLYIGKANLPTSILNTMVNNSQAGAITVVPSGNGEQNILVAYSESSGGVLLTIDGGGSINAPNSDNTVRTLTLVGGFANPAYALKINAATNFSKSAWGTAGAALQVAASTYNDSSTATSGTAASETFTSFGQPTLKSTNATVTTTNAATVYIDNAPVAGTNMTITNAYALWVAAGRVLLAGGLTVTGAKTILAATTTGYASLNLPSGTAPSTPGSGDLWWDGTALSFRTASSTVNLLSATLSIGSSIGSSTIGSVLFVGGSTDLQQDNSNFFWDVTNHTFGVGTTRTGAISGTNPRERIKGSGTTSATSSFEVQDSGATTLFFVRDDGLIKLGSKGTYTESTGQVALTATGSTGGIVLGGDANLYRSAASTLKTDNSLIVGTNLSVLNAGTFSFYESGSVNFSSFAAGTQAADLNYTLPTSQPTTNQVLTATAVSGAGPYTITLGWAAASASISIGSSITSSTIGSVLFVGGSTDLQQDNSNFFWDATNHTLGEGTTRTGAISGTNPRTRIKGSGTTSSTSSFEVQDSGASTIFFVRDDGLVGIGTNAPASKFNIVGNLTASAWTTNGIGIRVNAATYTDSSTLTSGTVASSGIHAFAQPTIAASNTTVTYTSAATIYIANAPTAGTNVTITNAYALWVAAGAVRFDGNINLNAITSGSVLFAGTSGVISQDNSNFFWDGTNHTLGVGTTRTGAISGTNPSLRIKGTGTTSSTSSFEVQDSGAGSLFLIRDDGVIKFGTNGTYTNSTSQLALATGSGAGLLIGASSLTEQSLTYHSGGSSYTVIKTPAAHDTDLYVVARGMYDETSTTPGAYMGRYSGDNTPRMGFFNGTAAQNWQIDNSAGTFRWYLPGVVHMSLTSTTFDLINNKTVQNVGNFTYNGAITQSGTNGNTFTASVTFSRTGGPSILATGAPQTNSTVALVRIGSNAITGGSASGTYFAINADSGYTGDLLNFQLNANITTNVDRYGTWHYGPGSQLDIPAWGTTGVYFDAKAGTFRDSSTATSGTATNAVFTSFAQPTLTATNTSVTTTNAATVYIANAPTAGTNQTITNAFSLWVAAGLTRLDAGLRVTGAITGTTSLTLGAASGTTGSLLLSGTTSGTITITPQAAAGTYNFNLPTTVGTAGYLLTSQGGGGTAMTWTDPATLSGGSMTWTTVTGTSQTAATNNGYITNNAGLVTVTLPTPAVGSVVEIVGLGAGGWKAQCASTHTIRLGTTVSAATGFAASTAASDSIRILGISTTQWQIIYAVGTIDVT